MNTGRKGGEREKIQRKLKEKKKEFDFHSFSRTQFFSHFSLESIPKGFTPKQI